MKKITDILGLKEKESAAISEKLNKLLSDYNIYYQNLRAFHWLIQGEKFFVLHEKFEELYNDAFVKIDEIAERILTIGGKPLHTYEEYIKNSSIKVEKDKTDATSTVAATLDNLSKLISVERSILAMAGDAEDEGTAAMMGDYISQQEKVVWLLSAFMK